MEIDTQHAVRMFFPSTSFRQVFLEAVANALDAGASSIRIKIDSDGDITASRLALTITDNGQGFTDERYAHFKRLQTPKDSYHKGLGRLVYLQYFNAVHVESVFGGVLRTFVFTDSFKGNSEERPATLESEAGTTLRFSSFRRDRLRSYDDLKPESVKRSLLEEFLPQLHAKKMRNEPFLIEISLHTEVAREQADFFSQTIALIPADIPTFKSIEVVDPELGAFAKVTMSYVVYQDKGEGDVRTLVSIDGRAVPISLLKRQPLPIGKSAVVLFESDIFVGQSDPARQRLVLPDEIRPDVVFRVLKRHVASAISQEVPEIEDRNRKSVAHFEERYPHLVGLFESDTVGLIDREEAVKVAQAKFFAKQRDVLEGDALDDRVFAESLELSSRSLAEYILYRDMIIKRLDGTPPEAREEVVHNLISPQRKRFEAKSLVDDIYANNAWLLDDKFMTFRTVLSEARMQEVVDAITIDADRVNDLGRPDISFIFSADPAAGHSVDVVIVEVKRREADDKEGPYAATQLIKRATKLVKHCPNIQRMWYFGIVEIDAEVAALLPNLNWKPLFSKGHVFYQEYTVEGRPTPVFLMSWQAVVEDAAARNHTFLEILKHDIKSQTVSERAEDVAELSLNTDAAEAAQG